MPGKTTKNKSKTPAGNPGLISETTSKERDPDHTMSPNASSVAAGELPRQETQNEENDAALEAFSELYDMTEDETAVDPAPSQIKDHAMDDGNEEEDAFLLPESQNFIPGTAEDFTENMRFNGLRWRH
jgi:hypothetical protein